VTEQQVPVIRTVITPQGYARAAITACPRSVRDAGPRKPSAFCTRSGWSDGWLRLLELDSPTRSTSPGDGFDYMCLNGVWEGRTGSNRAQSHRCGTSDSRPIAGPAKAVGQGKLSVIFRHAAGESLPRPFPTSLRAMSAHLKLLHDRFPTAWAQVLAGNPRGTGLELGAHGSSQRARSSRQRHGCTVRGVHDDERVRLALEEIAELRGADTQPSTVDIR